MVEKAIPREAPGDRRFAKSQARLAILEWREPDPIPFRPQRYRKHRERRS